MAKVDYKRIWQDWKERQMRLFVSMYANAKLSDEKELIRECNLKRTELIEMDKYDGTQEFHNILHDLKEKTQCQKCGSEDIKIDELVEENSGWRLGYGYKCNTCGQIGIY